MERIAIIGRSGSGKSTLADKIGKILHRPVIHLDKIFWKPDWTSAFPVKQEWIDFVTKMTKEDEWIIDGNYYRSVLEPRLQRATVIIFMNYSIWVCLWRSIKRIFKKSELNDRHEGMKENFRWKFFWYLFIYPRKKILENILQYKSVKKVYVIKNNRDIASLIKDLS